MLSIPILYGVSIDKNSIRWYWELDGNSHAIYDSNGDIIAQIASNISEYVEVGLQENTSYIRKIKAFNSNEESNFSNICTVTTHSNQNIISNVLPYSDEFKNSINVVNDEIINNSLNAFTTGVGDKFDLKVTKQGIEDYSNTFSLIGKVYGKYYKNISSFQRVKFNYRVKAIARYEKETCEGYVNLKLNATTTDKIKVRIYRYATKDMNVSAKVQCKVSYYEKISNSWMPKTKTIYSNEYNANLPSSVTYTKNGNAILDIKNNVLINSDAIGHVMWNIAMSDPLIKASHDNGMNVNLFEYKLYDNYAFNTSDDRYSPNKPRPFKLAQYGTIQAHTSSSTTTSTNSGIYMSGYSEGQLFDCERIVEKTITGNNNEVVVISKDDINSLMPTCISDRNYVFDGNQSSIVTKVEILSIGPTITITSNDINSDKTLAVSASTFYETPLLKYSFSDTTKNHYISTENIFNNMLKDYTIEYNYTLSIIDCTSNIKLNGSTQIESNYSCTWKDDYMSGFSLEAKESKVVLPWEYVYPEYPNEGLNGIVNSINSIDGTCVKKDLLVQLPEVYIPQEMFDVSFQLITENITPENSHLEGGFLNANSQGSTTINGDFAQFSSSATKPEVKEMKDLLKIDNLDIITLEDTTTKEYVINIAKPILSSEQESLYTSYELKLETDSNDINIFNYNINLIFDENNECVVPYKCKVLRNATSKWHPYIHNGYYYINQHEYYMFSQSNISGDYIDNYEYNTKNVNYRIKVDLRQNQNTNNVYSFSYSKMQDYNINSTSFVEYKDNYLMPKPTVQTKYYKEYKNVEHVICDISLPKKATSYSAITYSLSNNAKQIKLLGRSISENGIWSNWFEITNNSIPTFPCSHKIQLRADYTPSVDNVKEKITETLSDLMDFNNDMDFELSKNVITANGILENQTDDNAIYFSKILDFHNDTTFKMDAYYTCSNTNDSYYVTIHSASSNNKDDLKYNPNWVLMDDNAKVSGKYIRYRVEFTNNIKIIALYKHIDTLKTITNPQGINNISFSVNVQAQDLEDKTLSFDKNAIIKCNKEDHLVVSNIREVVSPVVNSYGYNDSDISNVEVTTNDKDFTISVVDNTIDFNNSIISKVFSNWNRVSNLGNKYPGLSNELNYWVFDNNNNEMIYNYKSNSFVAITSPQSYCSYQIKATLNSNDYNDNHICLLLAHTTDSYNKEYTLSVLVSPGYDSYKIVYNYMQDNEKTLVDCKDKVINNQDLMYWSQLQYGIRLDIERDDNKFIVKRSQENQNNIDNNTIVEIDINEYPQLSIFKNGSSIGFGSKGVCSIFNNIIITISDKANSSISIKSNNIKINHKDGEYLNVEDNKIIVTPFPQQYCPIIVYTDEDKYLKRIFYRDENGRYSLDIKEQFYKTNNNMYVLTERDVDADCLEVSVNDTIINEFNISLNILEINLDTFDGDIITVKYRVKNSFVANYNLHSNEVCINMHTLSESSKAIVRYETNLVDNRKEIKNICLNPIYNTDTKGFVYLSYEDNIVDNINIHCNPKSVMANGIDSISIYYEAIDDIGNPVQGVEISSYCVSGTLLVENNITDENGVVNARYISCNKPNIDTICVYNTAYGVEAKININNIEVV